MNWGYYIKQLREEANLTQDELANRSGLKRSHISRIELGSFKGFKKELIDKLALGLNKKSTDITDMIYQRKERPLKETPEQILERLRVSISATVPVYEDYPLHAGAPVEPMDYVPIVRDRAMGRNLEGYIVHGKCLEPEISDGNIIIVDRNGQIDNGDIVACLFDDMLHLARLRIIGDEKYLENNHGRMKLEEVKLAAPVIEVRRKLK